MADFRSWLVLGRVSNLSTVWANGLCAWMLGGGGSMETLAGLLAGVSLLYLGGMYLNDFCDLDFDIRHRPERPIPSGKIRRATVLAAVLVFLAGGLGLIWVIDSRTLVYGLALVGLIVAYNLVHKHSFLGIPLMGACRTGVYLVVGSATLAGLSPAIWMAGSLMFFYVLGVTALARTESTSRRGSIPGYVFLAIPLTGLLYQAWPKLEPLFPISFCLAVLWLTLTFWRASRSGKFILGKTIGPLLAGICLIDLAILNSMHVVGFATMGLFLAFFAMALVAQRFVPAT